MPEGSLGIGWNEEAKKEPAAPVGTSDLNQDKENMNLTKEEMRAIIKRVKDKYPDDLIQPLILKGVTNTANRFYVLRAITLADMGEIEDLMATFEEQELKTVKTSAKAEWQRLRKRENKPIEDINNLTEDQANELKSYIDEYVRGNIPQISKRVNEMVVNVVGVRFPETHAKKVSSRMVPYGDVVMVASSVQVFSGWSEIETDIEAYNDADLDQAYEGLEEQT